MCKVKLTPREDYLPRVKEISAAKIQFGRYLLAIAS